MDDSGQAKPFPLPILTPRLKLRPFTTEDEPDLLDLFSDEASYDLSESFPADEEEIRHWFEASRTTKMDDPSWYLNLGAQPKDGARLVGYVSFHFADHEHTEGQHRSGAFTMMVHRRYRTRGYGTEIVRGIMEFGFCAIGLHDVRVALDSRNVPARRALEAAGMRREGESIENRFVKGQWASTVYYAILGREYLAQTRPDDPMPTKMISARQP